jgi:hypothetical protein
MKSQLNKSKIKKILSYVSFGTIKYPIYSAKVIRYNYETLSPSWLIEVLDFPFDFCNAEIKSCSDNKNEDLELLLISKTISGGLLTYLFGSTKILEQYSKDQLQIVPGGPTISFSPPFPWNKNPTKQSYYTRSLHFLGYLVPLLEEARRANDQQYLITAENILLDWLKHNPYLGNLHKDAWYEGSVVHRIGTLLEFLKTYCFFGPSSRFPFHQLLAVIYQHISHLYFNRNKLYKLGNHGLRQDIVLIISSYVLPYFEEAKQWRQTGFIGLESQLENVCSQEGIWLEHSPGYQVYVDQWLWYLNNFLQHNQLPVPIYLTNYFENSDEYMTHMVMPDGKIPQIGDTSNIGAVQYLARNCSAETQYAISGGTEGRRPMQLDKVFSDAGQAILRDTWGQDPETYQKSFYIFIHSAQHLPQAHRHEDALSFLVYFNARSWIIDPGRNLMTLDKKFKSYFESAFAHNAHVINGKSISPRERPDLLAKISNESVLDSDVALLKAVSNRFVEPAEVTRYYILLRQYRLLIIFDHFQSDKQVQWQSLLHLAPDLEVFENNSTIIAQDLKSEDMSLKVYFENSLSQHSIRIFRGSDDPLLGWVFDLETRTIQPTSTIAVNRLLSEGYGLMALHWCPEDKGIIDHFKYEIINDRTYKINWIMDGNISEVTLITKPSLAIKYSIVDC